MNSQLHMRRYQQQEILTATPDQLVAKMYDIGVMACRTGDGSKVRRVLVELISSLNFEKGGEIASRLFNLYEFCMVECTAGNLDVVGELLTGIREAWRDGVLLRKAA